MCEFLNDARALLDNDRDRFIALYRHAFAALVGGTLQGWPEGSTADKVQQNMYSKVKGTAFDAFYMDLRMRMGNDPTLIGQV
ncbi:MAG: hypothetical protein WD250_00415 [Egibacteraceae bacterium]